VRTVFKGRPVEIEVENLNGDPVDVIAAYGHYLDTMQELNEDELDAVGMETDFSEVCMEHRLDRYDLERDR
jgi:hypothetical protein